jgi:uncharacterized protein YjiS (DUF1127 family)
MMTLLTTTRTAARLTQSMAIVKAACATAMAAVARRGETYHSLSALDDRTLQDIGLNRSMLISVACLFKAVCDSPTWSSATFRPASAQTSSRVAEWP